VTLSAPAKRLRVLHEHFRADAIALLVVTVAISVATGLLASSRPKYAAALLGGGVLLAFVARSPVNIAVAVAPSVFLIRRLPLGSSLSISDAILASAVIVSLPALVSMQPSQSARKIRRWFALYVGALSVAVIANYSGRSLLELLHRIVLVAGALMVGCWIASENRQRLALRWLVAGACVLAIAADIYALTHNFAAAQPLAFQKNYVGSILTLTLIVMIAAPRELGIRREITTVLVVLVLSGVLASQSRGAMVGTAAGAFACLIRSTGRDAQHRRATIASSVIVAAVLGYVAFYSVQVQRSDVQATKTTNSIAVRTQVEEYARKLWGTAPFTGVGIRYYTDPAFQARSPLVQGPNNAVDEALAESGVVGAAGLIIFLSGSIAVLARRRHPLAIAGLGLVVARLAHGMVDIYWTAGNSALPWLIVGMGVWLDDRQRSSPGPVPEPTRERQPVDA
jgi:hypothetical protein